MTLNAGTSMNFTTKGFYYEVEDLEINSENPSRGVSNEMVREKATIKINSGSAFIIQSRD